MWHICTMRIRCFHCRIGFSFPRMCMDPGVRMESRVRFPLTPSFLNPNLYSTPSRRMHNTHTLQTRGATKLFTASRIYGVWYPLWHASCALIVLTHRISPLRSKRPRIQFAALTFISSNNGKNWNCASRAVKRVVQVKFFTRSRYRFDNCVCRAHVNLDLDSTLKAEPYPKWYSSTCFVGLGTSLLAVWPCLVFIMWRTRPIAEVFLPPMRAILKPYQTREAWRSLI